MECEDNSMALAPPGLVRISDVAVAVERHLGISRAQAATILRPAIERGEIRYEIWGTDADRKDAPWHDRPPLAGPYILPMNVSSFGGWGRVDLVAGTIEGREIWVDWLDLYRFVDSNRSLFDLPAANTLGNNHGTIPPITRSLASSEKKCQAWLTKLMNASKDISQTNENLLFEALSLFPGLSGEAFKRAKKAAIEETGATAWRAPGRKTAR